MNKRNLALLISKHPLLKKLTEDKTIPNSVVARLIVEELNIDEAARPKDNIATKVRNHVDRMLKSGKTLDEIRAELSVESEIMKGWIESAKQKAGEDKEIQQQFLKILEKSVDKHLQRAEGILRLNQAVAKDPKMKDSAEAQKKELEAKVALEDEKLKKEEIVLYQKAQQASTALARQELDIEPIAKKFGEYEFFKPLNDEEKKVMFKFIALLKRNELFEGLADKTSLVKTFKDLGVKGVPNMEVILQYMTEPEQQTVQDILSNQDTSVEKFLAMLKKAELVPSPNQEPGKEEKPSTPMKGEPVAIDPEQTKTFVEAANALINDFYNQKYRKNQGIIVGNVINAMKAFVEDADLALAFGRPPTDEPQEQEATSEEPATLEEQEGEEVKADKDEMRNIRIGLRSFLSRVNKVNKYLSEFEKVAGAGSVLSDAYKKRFMDNLKEIQTAIYRLALVLNKMLADKEQINEKKESETMKKWKEVQKLYDLSIKSVSSVKELLDTETPPDELDSTLTNDAYTALIDLAGHFPSVAPFGAGKMKRSDFSEYKTKFANAIGQLKSDLQNVFNLIKTGEAGEESLQNARGGLRDFGDQIASIFGVPSRFKDAKVKPGDDKAPAVQEDPEAKKEPEEEKYSDEISEEDKELLSAALDEDKEFYQRATKRLKELNLDRAEDMGMVPDVPLNEIMKKTEDLIQDLESAKQRIQIGEKSLAKAGDSVTPKGKKRKELLKKSLQTYIKLYEKIQDSIRSGDMSKIYDSNPERVEKVSKLIDIAKRYLEEKSAINNLFVTVINDAFGDDKDLELIWKALKDADGKEAERLTSDMKFKIEKAGKNIKNTILNSFDLKDLDLSSFKKFVGMVADKISKTAIQLDKKINEEEDRNEKELKIYQKNFDKALQEMKSFVALYNAFDYAMDQIENDVGRTKFLEAFDEDFSTVKAQLSIMDNHLKRVATMFGTTITPTDAKLYGFPPKDFVKPEKKQEPSSDIEEPIQVEKNGFRFKLPPPPESVVKAAKTKSKQDEFNRIRDIIRDAASQNTGTAQIDLSNNIQKRVTDLVGEIGLGEPQQQEMKKYFDEQEKNMILFDKIMASSVPKEFDLPEKLKETLKLFKFHQAMRKESKIDEQVDIEGMIDKDLKLRKDINKFLEEYSAYQNEWLEIQKKANQYNQEVAKKFLQYLKNPIKFANSTEDKKNATQADIKDMYLTGSDFFTEQIIANKLKPLIREMLNKGK